MSLPKIKEKLYYPPEGETVPSPKLVIVLVIVPVSEVVRVVKNVYQTSSKPAIRILSELRVAVSN